MPGRRNLHSLATAVTQLTRLHDLPRRDLTELGRLMRDAVDLLVERVAEHHFGFANLGAHLGERSSYGCFSLRGDSELRPAPLGRQFTGHGSLR
jgi:hypothetical protein